MMLMMSAFAAQAHAYAADAVLVYLIEAPIQDQVEAAVRPLDEALHGAISELLEAGDFSGKSSEISVIYTRGMIPAKRVILVGLGKLAEFTTDVVRRAVATGLQKARSLKVKHVATVTLGIGRGVLNSALAAEAIVEGAMLGLYQYHGQKTSDQPPALPEKLDVLAASEEDLAGIATGLAKGQALSSGAILARDLVNLPPNICTPSYLAEQAVALGKSVGLEVTVLERSQMEALKMGALLAVAQGSDTPPRFIIMEHNPKKIENPETVVFVGKGVTFDTGGYSLKSADGMVGMKADMAGAAAVMGAMKIVALLNLPLHVVGLIPSADNMINGHAYRPQEVITASNGKTIEIISTDAEGRLLLADALVYAKRYNPSAVLDIATLTGAVVVALGYLASGVFTDNDVLFDVLQDASDMTAERIWRLPMFPEFDKLIESDTADVKNSGGAEARGGGASIGAVFLKHFVDYPIWAHIDMAGEMSSKGEVPYMPKGATGYGARLLAEFARRWVERAK